jgi:hypothetical protein
LNDRQSDPINRGAAAVLRRLADGHAAERFSVTDLLSALGDQGFGLLVLALALPNAVPGPLIPGFSVPFALGIAVLGLQLATGLHTPRLPEWLKRRSMSREHFRRFVDRTEPLLRRIENWFHFSSASFGERPRPRLVGMALILLSIVLALPVPFGNLPVALSIIVIALGLLEDDSVALTLGLAAGAAALAWNVVMVFAGAVLVEAVTHLR